MSHEGHIQAIRHHLPDRYKIRHEGIFFPKLLFFHDYFHTDGNICHIIARVRFPFILQHKQIRSRCIFTMLHNGADAVWCEPRRQTLLLLPTVTVATSTPHVITVLLTQCKAHQWQLTLRKKGPDRIP